MPYSGDHGANITACNFKSLITSSLCTPYYGSYQSTNQRMIYLEGVKGLTIGISSSSVGTPNTFLEPEGTSGWYGIEAYNTTGASLGGTHEIAILSNLTSGGVGNTFDGPFNSCVASLVTSSNVSKGFHISQNSFGSISGSITHPVNGIVFQQTDASQVGESTGGTNTFTDLVNGMQFIADIAGASGVTVQHNDFKTNTYGLVIAPTVYPITMGTGGLINISTTSINLTIYCNKFYYNDFGIIGSGSLISQGSFAASASNNFSAYSGGSGTTSLNNKGDIFLQNAPSMIYNYYSSTVPTHLISGTSVDINYNHYTGSSTGSGSYAPSPNAACLGSWKQGWTGIEIKNIAQLIKVFPNPTNNLFMVQIQDADLALNYKMEVFDALGQIICKKTLQGAMPQEIDGSQWQSGLYSLRFTDSDGHTYLTRLVIAR